MREWCPLKCGGWREWLDALPIIKSVSLLMFSSNTSTLSIPVQATDGYSSLPTNLKVPGWMSQANHKHESSTVALSPKRSWRAPAWAWKMTEQDVSDVSVHIGRGMLWINRINLEHIWKKKHIFVFGSLILIDTPYSSHIILLITHYSYSVRFWGGRHKPTSTIKYKSFSFKCFNLYQHLT